MPAIDAISWLKSLIDILDLDHCQVFVENCHQGTRKQHLAEDLLGASERQEEDAQEEAAGASLLI